MWASCVQYQVLLTTHLQKGHLFKKDKICNDIAKSLYNKIRTIIIVQMLMTVILTSKSTHINLSDIVHALLRKSLCIKTIPEFLQYLTPLEICKTQI